MDVNAIGPSGAGTTNSSDLNGARKALVGSDFETFLKMLTTQMQNQDPLNPLDSADFAVQLATFSGVEQQVRTNSLLENVFGGLGATGLAQYAGWVGMEARVAGPARFDGAPIRLSVNPSPASEAASLVVRDSFGREVVREALPLGEDTILWGGTVNGAPLPPGLYTFEVESFSGGEVLGTSSAEHYALVREAVLGPSGVELFVGSGVRIPAAEVTALRAPDATP